MNQEEILVDQFEEWLKHPVTTLVLKSVQKHKEKFAVSLMNGTDDYTIPDQRFRNLSFGMRTVDCVLKIMTDFPTLKKQIEQPKQAQ